MFFETVKMSLKNLISNKLRTFLTVLGVVIGIASIIALLTLVQGGTDKVTGEFEAAGANKLQITIMASSDKFGLSESDFAILRNVENVADISFATSTKRSVSYLGDYADNIKIEAKSESFYDNYTEILTHGRVLKQVDYDNGSTVCLITSNLSKQLFGREIPLGKQLSIGGISFTIVGILDSENTTVGTSKMVHIPYDTGRDLLNMGNARSADIFLSDTDLSDETTRNIEKVLFNLFNEDENAYSVFDTKIVLEILNTVMSTMSGLLAGIAAISLLVGGIGIMNMMLVSVSERTNEIGLRKALGAKPNAILMQFLIEAIFISILGGVLGVVFGVGISYIIGTIFAIAPAITLGIVSLAVGFSVAVGIIFGIMPAKRAAGLNPIDALRSN